MMGKHLFFVLAILSLALSSCKTQFSKLIESNDVEAKYSAAFQLFADGKYSRAAEMFESLTVYTGGLPKDDTVHFYWGLSNYRCRDYMTAEGVFEKFVDVYPLSAFATEAKFYLMDCLYRSTYRYELDQKPTYKAISAITQYVAENPNSEYVPRCGEMLNDLKGRLEEKAFRGAHLYYHMEDYLAAHYALKNVLKENADNRFREEILYYIAMSSYKYAQGSVAKKQRERYLTFVDDYFNVVSEFPESKYRRDLDPYYKKVQKILEKSEK